MGLYLLVFLSFWSHRLSDGAGCGTTKEFDRHLVCLLLFVRRSSLELHLFHPKASACSGPLHTFSRPSFVCFFHPLPFGTGAATGIGLSYCLVTRGKLFIARPLLKVPQNHLIQL